MSKRKKIKTRNKILVLYGGFIAVNVVIAWIAFFRYQSVPDTLLTLIMGVGGIVDVMTAIVAIKEKNKGE